MLLKACLTSRHCMKPKEHGKNKLCRERTPPGKDGRKKEDEERWGGGKKALRITNRSSCPSLFRQRS